jgi:hypothetical protein
LTSRPAAARFTELAIARLADRSRLVNLKTDANGKFLIYQQPLSKIDGAPAELAGYRVLVISSRSELLSVFDGIFWISWVALAVMLAGGLVLIRLYRGSITSPLMRLRHQAEQVAFREASGTHRFDLLYPKGWAIEEIVSVQDAVERMAGNLYKLYRELRDQVDRDQESGLLSLIGAADRLEQSAWEQATVCMVEINNYMVLADTLNKVALRHLWQSLCQQVAPVWGDFAAQRLVRCRYSESRVAVVMLARLPNMKTCRCACAASPNWCWPPAGRRGARVPQYWRERLRTAQQGRHGKKPGQCCRRTAPGAAAGWWRVLRVPAVHAGTRRTGAGTVGGHGCGHAGGRVQHGLPAHLRSAQRRLARCGGIDALALASLRPGLASGIHSAG